MTQNYPEAVSFPEYARLTARSTSDEHLSCSSHTALMSISHVPLDPEGSLAQIRAPSPSLSVFAGVATRACAG